MIDLPPFQQMWTNYPTEGVITVATDIGGAVSRNVISSLATDSPWNTCTIRLSKSFNYAGHRIPRGHKLTRAPDSRPMRTVSGTDGYQYAYRVREMDYYLHEIFGAADGSFTVSQGGVNALQNTPIPDQHLLLVFYFTDAASGRSANHADLWDGKSMRYNNVLLNPGHSSLEVKYWEFIR